MNKESNKHHFPLIDFEPKKDSPFKVEVNLEIDNELQMTINYSILGDLTQIEIPKLQEDIKRVIGLWESTCFEIFFKKPNSTNYFELNFSPEGHFNCFYFDKPGDFIKPYPIKFYPFTTVSKKLIKNGYYKLQIEFELKQIFTLFKDIKSIDIGISSVILKDDELSYWALSHFGQTPNFHDFKSFTSWDLETKLSH